MKRSILVASGIGLALMLGFACANVSEYQVASTPAVVGADLHILIEKTDTGNFMVTLEAQYLTPPDRVAEGLSVFVVWAKAPDQPAMRLGQLNFDPDTREGTMQATTTNRGFDIIVTAELSPDVTVPGDTIIFQQTVAAPQ